MSVHFYSDDEDEEAVVDITSNEFTVSGRDSIIFVIDCCKEMFAVGDDEEAPFNRIVSAIHDMMLNKIITSDKDLHGVIFCGTKDKQNSSEFPGVFEWLKFDVPSIQSIQELRAMQNCDHSQFSEKYGFSTGDENARKRARAKATDLHDHKVEVEVLSFNTNFRYERFYKDIVSDPDNPEPSFENPIDCIKNLYSFLLRKLTKQRPLTRVPLIIGTDVELSVGVYMVARRTTKTASISIDSSTNQEVRRHSSMVDSNTGEILMPSDIKLMQTWGGREIVFEREEVKKLRKIGKRGLQLLGFKPRKKTIKPWYHVRNAQFIYPDDISIKGSSTLFTALLQKCLERDVVAICSYAARESSPPRCVALLPQDEKVDPDSSEQISPPGFYIIFLPFADDIRHVEVERNLPQPSSEQVEAAEAMIKRLRFSYDPENFDNPSIQTHYRYLEAVALDKDEPEQIENHTVPDYESIEKKAGSHIRNFKQLVFSPGYEEKMKGGKNSTGSRRKAEEEVLQVDVQEYVTQKKLGKLTVQGLKDICRAYSIKSSGRKADIIKAIEEHFSST